MPVILLLFAYVFGGTLGAGIGGDRSAYVNYLTPGILLLTMAGAAAGTAISVAMDMTEAIVDRFRSMAIARISLLTGHVLRTFGEYQPFTPIIETSAVCCSAQRSAPARSPRSPRAQASR
jgi:hypothetical protein